jgi:hypothetical protein
MKNFNSIANPPARTQPPVDRAKFVPPPILTPTPKEQDPRHRVHHIEYPKTNLNRFLRKPLTLIDKLISPPIHSKEREKLLILGQQGIISSAAALGSQRIPDNIKTIELLEIPNTKEYQDFRLIGYETLDDYPNPSAPIFRRTKSMKNTNNQSEISTKRGSTNITDINSDYSTKLSTPLKSIKRNMHNKNETAIHNKQVFKEKSKGKTNRRKSNIGNL